MKLVTVTILLIIIGISLSMAQQPKSEIPRLHGPLVGPGEPRGPHICPLGQSWQDGCYRWEPAKPGQLVGPCVKSGWSCKQVPEQTQ